MTRPVELVALGAGAGLVALAALWLIGRQAGAAAQAVGGAVAGAAAAVNPYSNENFIYDDVIGGAGRAITSDNSWSLGGWIYDLVNRDEDRKLRCQLRGECD